MGNSKLNSNATQVQVTRIRGFQCVRPNNEIGYDSSDSMTNSSIAAALGASRRMSATESVGEEGQLQVHATPGESNRLTVESTDDCRMQAKRQRAHLRRMQRGTSGSVDLDRPDAHAAPIFDANAAWEMPKVCLLCRRTMQSDEANCDCCCCGVDYAAAEPAMTQLRGQCQGVRWSTPQTPCDHRQASEPTASTIFAEDYDPDGHKGGGGRRRGRRRRSGSFCAGDRDECSRRQAIVEQPPPRATRLRPNSPQRLSIEALLILMHMHFLRFLSIVTFGSLAATCNATVTENSQRPRGTAGNRPIKRLNTPYDSLYAMPQQTQHHRQHNHQQQRSTLEAQRVVGSRKSFPHVPNVAPLFSMLLGVSLVLALLPPAVRAAHTSLLPNGLGDSTAGLATAVTPAIHRSAPADITAPLRSFGATDDSDDTLKPFILPALKAFAGNSAPAAGSHRAANRMAADDQPGRLATREYVCKSMDIRNEPAELEHLRNCTVIEGFLIVTLMNTGGQIREFNETFPLLTEITEYLIIYRVHNLRSLSQIFPNLSIIRGNRLLEGFALIIEFNPHLEDIGLSKLLAVRKGGVRIANNLSLCFVETVDWSLITSELVHRKNRPTIECPKCPGDDGATDRSLSCGKRDGKSRCWSSTACQKLCPKACPNNCVDEHTCCNPNCTGGCLPGDPNACIGCDGFTHNHTSCVRECPRDYLKYLDRRCLTVDTCKQIRWKLEGNKQMRLMPFRDECLTNCPAGYIKVNFTCVVCDDNCASRCKGGVIDSAERAKMFAPCTHIVEEGLTINIKRGGRHLMNDLMFGLSQIKVVDTFIKVHHTYGLFSLEFFKSLEAINGKSKYDGRYSLYVLENNDLETLWGPNRTVRINEGRVFFHFNPKLCLSEIQNLRPMMKENDPFDKNEVALDTNGEKGSCNTENLPVKLLFVDSTMASVRIEEPLEFEDTRSFIGYQFYSMESKDQNATKSGHRVCDDGWSAGDPTKDTTSYYVGLKPYTQYAYYVKTLTISSEPRNAQSEIGYFTTRADQPMRVTNLKVVSETSSTITVSWAPPYQAYGKLESYVIRAEFDSRVQKMDSRNYCQDPVVITNPHDSEDKPAETEKAKKTDVDCQCDAKPMDPTSETDDVTLHEEINFENMLQNHIYVKVKQEELEFSLDDGNEIVKRERRSINSFLVRHMRALPNESTNAIGESTTSTTTTLPPKAGSQPKTALVAAGGFPGPYEPFEEERNDTNKEYVELVVKVVNASMHTITLPRLKHFATYKVGVRVCREAEDEDIYPISKTAAKKERCSEEDTRYVRTMKMDLVDKVENLKGVVENTNTSRSTVRLTWDPPTRPNGHVVSYTIKFQQKSTDDASVEKRCISEIDFRKMPAGYLLTNLAAGNYSFSVAANSLAGDGIESKPIYVYIPPTTLSNTTIALLCLAPLVLLAGIAYGVYYCRKKLLAPPSDLKMFPTVNPYYMSTQYIADDWEVPRDRVIQLSPLGQGSFGMVYEGIVKGYNNSSEDTPCAIKTVNENATDRERMNFLNEASVMKEFDTYHVVRLLGVCSLGQPALVIMELMKNGDLKCYLRAHRNEERDELGMLGMEMRESLQPPPLQRIYQMAIEIADGMAYLSAKKFVHRDLAARNCMVAADLTVKIGDFGMTRDIYETDYYRKGTKGLLPVRWMPPESLRDGVYSSASDVFSYGVVLWEMATLASQPYQGMSNEQVLRYVIDGGVMERPVRCPDKLYRLMQRCWHHRPSARPTFMEIITSMVDIAEPHFQRVSFYHSEEGEEVRLKEEKSQHSGQIFSDPENNMDDARTPLRAGEYGEYKLHVENNSSVEHAGDIDDDHPHSPYSLGSANIISSTPDGQSKNSYNLSQMSHTNPPAPLNSAPTASATSGSAPHMLLHHPHHQLQHPHTHPYQRQLHLPAMPPRYIHGGEEASAYVQPDFHEHEFPGADNGGTAGGRVPRTSETDERGYEVYDPSPNYRDHVPGGYEGRAPVAGHDDDEPDHYDDDDGGGGGGLQRTGSKLSGGENLLPRPAKGQRTRQPIISPMSSSMPDEVTSVPMSSSLHPSTASAASSNASSTAATTTTTGLKKAVADAMHNVGNSLMPSRLRNMNRRIFHKRSGSNASHKSTSSNPNTTSSSASNTNLTMGGSSAPSGVGGRGKSLSGQNLGTIESGGSGSAGSYTGAAIAPRLYGKNSATTSPRGEPATISANPNYVMLDESANASGISAAVTPLKGKRTLPASFVAGSNPNYLLLDESLNTTGGGYSTPARNPPARHLATTDNPNYEPMQAPGLTSSDNPNYVLMNAPDYSALEAPSINVSDNPNYQMMQPPPPPQQQPQPASKPSVSQPFAAMSALLRREQSRERFHNSASSDDEAEHDDDDDDGLDDEDDEDDDAHNDLNAEHMKMEKLPLNRQRSSERSQQKRSASRSRSRSHSQARSDERLTPVTGGNNAGVGPAGRSNAFSLKEKWLMPQQGQSQTPQPPNGFIGREG